MVKKQSQELELRDKKLLQMAANGATGEMFEQKFGIPAAQAIVRVRELLSSLDVWDEIERRKLLLYSAYDLKSKIEEVLEADDSKQVDSYIRLLKTLSDLFDKQAKITDEELQTVTRAQGRVLLQLVEAGYEHARNLLSDEYPNVDLQAIDEAFRKGLSESLRGDDDEDGD